MTADPHWPEALKTARVAIRRRSRGDFILSVSLGEVERVLGEAQSSRFSADDDAWVAFAAERLASALLKRGRLADTAFEALFTSAESDWAHREAA